MRINSHPDIRKGGLRVRVDPQLDQKNAWIADFFRASPLFDSIARRFGAEIGQFHEWPNTESLNALAANSRHPVLSASGAQISFATPADSPAHGFASQYEPQIYLTGAVPTRPACWHDFFGALCWMLFPSTKATLNALHYQASLARSQQLMRKSQRSPIENAATLFDESGAIAISDDPELLEMIRRMQWKELFWHRRERTRANLRVIVFGHALYEKALHPYLGLTAQTVLVETATADLARNDAPDLDQQIAQWWLPSRTPRDLLPLPILGVPGYSTDNETESYYDNTNYFRPSRR